MIDVHLYGKLRRFSDRRAVTSDSVVRLMWRTQDTVSRVIARLGIPVAEIGSNIFLNGKYASLESPVQDGDRLGLFPDDMQLLYKWYFAPTSSGAAASSGAPASSGAADSTGEQQNGDKDPER
jgi:molybdopterin converting factor small subunit